MKAPKVNVQALKEALNSACLSKRICNHLLGEEHTLVHRLSVGAIILFCGVCVSKIHFEAMLFHIIFDGVGYTIHAIGAIPFLEMIVSKK